MDGLRRPLSTEGLELLEERSGTDGRKKERERLEASIFALRYVVARLISRVLRKGAFEGEKGRKGRDEND